MPGVSTGPEVSPGDHWVKSPKSNKIKMGIIDTVRKAGSRTGKLVRGKIQTLHTAIPGFPPALTDLIKEHRSRN